MMFSNKTFNNLNLTDVQSVAINELQNKYFESYNNANGEISLNKDNIATHLGTTVKFLKLNFIMTMKDGSTYNFSVVVNNTDAAS